MAITNQNKVKQLYPDAREVRQDRLTRIVSDEFGHLSAWFFDPKDAWKHAAKGV